MKTVESIELFLKQTSIAVVGVSRNKNKFGNTVYRELKKKGINVLPVNPHLAVFEGDKCYTFIDALPADVTAIFINTPPVETIKIIEESLKKGIKHFWLQQGSTNDEVIEFLKGKDANFICDRCILMFAGPVHSIHKFHRFLSKVTGNFPK
jgi:uncharacterized protein